MHERLPVWLVKGPHAKQPWLRKLTEGKNADGIFPIAEGIADSALNNTAGRPCTANV